MILFSLSTNTKMESNQKDLPSHHRKRRAHTIPSQILYFVPFVPFYTETTHDHCPLLPFYFFLLCTFSLPRERNFIYDFSSVVISFSSILYTGKHIPPFAHKTRNRQKPSRQDLSMTRIYKTIYADVLSSVLHL